jgi:hypothetical protein
MTQSIAFKRGSSFSARAAYTPVAGQPADLSGIIITSQVRTQPGALVDTLAVTVDADALGFQVSAPAGTASWPIGVLVWDLKLSAPGAIAYTETVKIVVQQEVTA